MRLGGVGSLHYLHFVTCFRRPQLNSTIIEAISGASGEVAQVKTCHLGGFVYAVDCRSIRVVLFLSMDHILQTPETRCVTVLCHCAAKPTCCDCLVCDTGTNYLLARPHCA